MPKRRKPRKKKKSGGAAKYIFALAAVASLAGGWWWYSGQPNAPRWFQADHWRTHFHWLNSTSAASATEPARREPIQRAQPAPPLVRTNVAPSPVPDFPVNSAASARPVRSILEAQIALARIGISVGCIDGANGNNMKRALLAFQIHNNLPVSGELDHETKQAIRVEEPLFTHYTVSTEDLKSIMKVPAGWLAKSELDRLGFESILELVSEKGRSSTSFIRSLNPGIDWSNVQPGTPVKIPAIAQPPILERAAFVRVHIYSKTLDVFGRSTNLIAHYPCSIAAKVEKRPIGTLYVAKTAANPNYLFNPEVFSESAEARRIGRKLVIPPGPNNPVGTAWIGLDKPGYGIHGTPKPEQIGRTESHGCFRLANWNAEHLLQLVWSGMPVIVEP